MAVVKEGYVKRHSKNMFSGGWNDVYLKLYSDSNLLAFKKQGDRDPKVQILMKNVCKHFAYGEHAMKNFPDMPQLPGGANINCVLAIPEKPSHKAKPHYFLLSNEQHMHEWMSAICGTLPARPQSSQAPIQPSTVQHVDAPPPYGAQPGMPMPQPVGFDGMAPPAGAYQAPYQQPAAPYPQQAPGPYPQQPGYPAQPYPTQPGPYPTQPGPYPQQAGYPQQPMGYQQQPYYGQQQPYGYQQPPPGQYGYAQQQPNVVYVNDHNRHKGGGGLGGIMGGSALGGALGGGHRSGGGGGGILSSNKGKMAAGLLGGAALGYGASRMMGGGFGGFGMGRMGSWSSLSSMGSFGSCGSFGSFD